MRKAKIAETVIVGIVALAAVIAVACIMSLSYTAWKSGYDAAMAGNVKPPKQVLQSIEVSLADGKVYYDNNLATVRSEDITVTAHYLLGEEEITEAIDPNECNISVPSDFVTNGGTVTVTYKSKKATLDITLVAVALDSVEIVQNPYTVAYKTGSPFSDEGMKAYAVYNDGSRKLLAVSDYTVDVITALKPSDTSRTLSYTEGGITRTADIPITVSDNFSDGSVKSISAADECYAEVGTDIVDVVPSLKITYESGNSKPAGKDFVISNDSEIVRLGKSYTLKVRYKGNQRLSAEIPVIVRSHVEAEDTKITGGKKNTETSYLFEGGKFIKSDDVTFAGGFSKEVNSGNEGSFVAEITSYTDCTASITMRCGNSYATRDDAGYYWMKPLQINSIMDLSVNGEQVAIGNNVILKGCGPSETNTGSSSSYAPLFGVYYEFTFDNVPLSAGTNTVKFEFKQSTLGESNCWGEKLSTMNVDWFDIFTEGVTVDKTATVRSVELGYIGIDYGDTVADAVEAVTVIGKMSDGSRVLMDSSLFDISIVSGDVSDGTIACDTYKFKAALKTDPNMFAESEVKVEHYECIATQAELIEDGGKVYWAFTFRSVGYTEKDYEFYDGTTTFEIAQANIGKNVAVFRIDVTDFKAGADAYYPHLRLSGTNYVNGANANGDIRGASLSFTDGQTVTVGNKTYKLHKEYSMPSLVITQTD